ncbi:MAG: hypothetical protein EOO47_17920, partial [Flavobacterium sp.]
AVALFYGCASMQNPQGGPKDTTPPKLVKAEPKNLSVNFKAEKILLDFDEYIKLNNEFKEFSISPEMEKPPVLKAKLKRLTIDLKDSLEKNTTYTLNFGKAITDITESNPIKNFTYVFSTGPTLDSLSLSGNVKNAISGQPEIDAVVLILPLNRDSIFGKKKPSIYTTTDSSGNYKLNNLREGTYKVYALKEKSGDKIYQQESDEVGFIKDPIVLNKNIDSANLQIFKENASKFRILDRRLNNDGSINLIFNQWLKKPELTVVEPTSVDADKIIKYNKTNDSAKVWLADLSFDSVKIAIKDEGKLLETVKFTRGKRDTYARNVTATDNLEGDLLNPYKGLKLTFNFPITAVDLAKITLLEDSIPRTGFTLTKDSIDFLTYNFKYLFKKKEKYILKIGEGAITGIFNSKNKEITKNFTLANADDYATSNIKVNLPDTGKQYILEIVNEKKDQVIFSKVITKSETVTLANFKPSIYFGRIVYDDNKNGIWDTGNVKEGTQPEKIWYEPKELSMKANWKREDTIEVPKI